MTIWWRYRLLLCLCLGAAWSFDSLGGGGSLNTVVVVNQNSTNSVRLGTYYCEKRQIPPQNLLRISWPGRNVEWTLQQFEQVLAAPLRAMLRDRNLRSQIEFVVLSMDIPYRVRDGASANSTTSALYYGFKADTAGGSCSLPAAAANPYASTEAAFRTVSNAPGFSNALLTTMITASNLATARLVADHGVAGDSTFPTQPVLLAKSADRLRNIRHLTFDNAVLDSRILNARPVTMADCADPSGLGCLAGYQNGMAVFNLGHTTFAPGALADALTSYAGLIFEPNDQTTLLAFINAGASGSYGTVAEPCAHLEKFPSPMVYFYQARGFNLAEAYYQSLSDPHQGLMLGDPLSAPFARAGTGQWLGLAEGDVLRGITNLTVAFAAPAEKTIKQIDLFLDGLMLQSVTNIAPCAGNLLQASIAGRIISYRVPPGAALGGVARGFAAEINKHQAATGVRATPIGDRVELKCFTWGRKGTAIRLAAQSEVGTGGILSTFAKVSGPQFLDTTARGLRSFSITNIPALGDWLQLIVLRTNGSTTVVGATNAIPGTTLAVLARTLLDIAASHPELEGIDGIAIEDVNMHEDYPFNVYIYGMEDHSGTFNVRANSPGWEPSRIRVCLRGSASLGIAPSGTNTLEENLEDLQPRAHIYLQAGLPSLTADVPLSTQGLPDGSHELTAVAYEGTHVRTQTRASRRVIIQNTAFSGSLRLVAGAPNTLLGAALIFEVEITGAPASKTELFSTGGLLQTSASGQSAAFFVAPAALGVGRHPFYAIITYPGGKQFRTDTLWIRLLDGEEAEPPFAVRAVFPPACLEWPATAGRTYEILCQNPPGSFLPVATVTATNTPVRWTIPFNPDDASSFLYRVRTEN